MGSVITVLVGHRGTGKSSLLKRIQHYHQKNTLPVLCQDLDEAIATGEGRYVTEIFERQGEAEFRNLEQKYFNKIISSYSNLQAPLFIAAGAGFQIPITENLKIIWVKRLTDESGRIFSHRPRLDKNVSPLSEYKNRFQERENYFKSIATETLVLSEGFDYPHKAEEDYFINSQNLGGIVTALPGSIKAPEKSTLVELRDDLLNQTEMTDLFSRIPKEKILFSFRKEKINTEDLNFNFDWPAEWGPSAKTPFIISSHSADSKALTEAGKNQKDSFLKWAPTISSFQELMRGHIWQQSAPARRVFLPMSSDGRWRWYRSFMQDQMPFQFWKEDLGSAADQPYLLEWARRREFQKPKIFAAVLGDPIEHSRSPGFHFDFFKEKNIPYYPIRVTREDWQNEALAILTQLGMRFCAVTSPLKEPAFEHSTPDFLSTELKSVNTLKWEGAKWVSTNTDKVGLESLLQSVTNFHKENVAVWGGGGTLSVLNQLLPEAQFFSARTGMLKGTNINPKIIDTIIWSVGRKNWQQSKRFPSFDWPVKTVIDLNYAEDSPGLEYALNTGARYISGLPMFEAQGKAQQNFWAK